MFTVCSGIPVFLASKGKENWFENRVVREIVGAGAWSIQRGKGNDVGWFEFSEG